MTDGRAQACYREQERQVAVSARSERETEVRAEATLSWDEAGREAKNGVSSFMENELNERHRGDWIMFKR